METLTSREAADTLGISVRQWHWLVEKHDLRPERELPGLRGAKFWSRSDVERVARERAEVPA